MEPTVRPRLELRYRWPDQRESLLAEVEQELATSDPVDVYFCPALRVSDARNGFGGQKATNAAPCRFLWADVDTPPDVTTLAKLDALVVNSGQTGHLHLYVALTEPVPVEQHRVPNKALAAYLGADAKWSDDALPRLPGTLNFKPTVPLEGCCRAGRRGAAHQAASQGVVGCRARRAAWRRPKQGHDAHRQRPIGKTTFTGTTEPAPNPLPSRVQAALDHPDTVDRSKAHARLVGACLDSGLTLGQTVTVCSGYGPSAEKYGERLPDEVARFWDKARTERETRTASTITQTPDGDEPISVVPFPTPEPRRVPRSPRQDRASGRSPHRSSPSRDPRPIPRPLRLHHRTQRTHPDRQHPPPRSAVPTDRRKDSDGAKGTSYQVVSALFAEAENHNRPNTRRSGLWLVQNGTSLRRVSDLSSGEGLIEAVRDPSLHVVPPRAPTTSGNVTLHNLRRSDFRTELATLFRGTGGRELAATRA